MSVRLGLAVLVAGATIWCSAAPAVAEVTVGAEAPDFALPGHDGNEVRLSSLRGERNVLLAFFPQAFTGG